MATFGKILFWVCGTILYLLSIYMFYTWFGGLGLLIAIFAFPVTILLPFIYLVLAGITPGVLLVFGIWILSLVGYALSNSRPKTETSQSAAGQKIEDGVAQLRSKRRIEREVTRLREVKHESETSTPSPAMIYCSNCGNKNPDTAKFCWKCGHALYSGHQ